VVALAAERVVAPAGATSFAERGAAPRLHWRLLCDEPLTGARNMALDHALAVSLGEGTAVLRLYRWSRPTVSFGRHEPARDVYDRTLGAALGLDFVRRSTGGGAVLHEGELTYAVVVPLRALGGPRTAYRRINEALAAGLRTLGADVAVSEHGLVRRPGAGPCFQAAAPGEIVARGRKLVGSAQRADRHALLQHGSILIESDQSLVAALQTVRAADPADDGAIGLATLLGRAPDPGELVEAVRAGFEQVLGIRLCASVLTGEEQARVAQLERHYGADTWTWRR
jgi:lipoate-protein ligase A